MNCKHKFVFSLNVSFMSSVLCMVEFICAAMHERAGQDDWSRRQTIYVCYFIDGEEYW